MVATIALLAGPALGAPGDIDTIAGTGVRGSTGDGGAATSAQIGFAAGVAIDGAGNVFIAEDHVVRRVDASTGIITTVAGTGTAGYSGDGGPATSAQLHTPGGMAVDSVGSLFIAESNGNRVRRIDAGTGVITTVAGTGVQGYSGDGGPATSATLRLPRDVAFDAADNLFIADLANHVVRRVDASTGVITTVAGTGASGFSGDGGSATAALLNQPIGVTLDPIDSSLYIADRNNHRVRKVDAATGVISSITPPGLFLTFPSDLALSPMGAVFVSDGGYVRRIDAAGSSFTIVAGNGGVGYSGDGGPATAATLRQPTGIALDGSGTSLRLVIADGHNYRVREVAEFCGSGILHDGDAEECDDGGTTPGDGCDAICTIEAGYECPTPGEACVDVDECALGTDNCDTNAACTNEPGAFSCTCHTGYSGDGVTCADTDGCNPDPCLNGGACSDVPAPGTGATCDCTGTGYEGATCGADIDECTLGTDDCDTNATCSNTPGSFTCTCNSGYSGDGVTCSDTDGCSPNPCLNGGGCTDVPAPGSGGTCDCAGTGYEGATCETDLDECTLETDNCGTNATCTNTPGSFTCACEPGYTGDGVSCTSLGPDHYVAYKIKAPKKDLFGAEIPDNKFPKDWVITVNDTVLESLDPAANDNPENFVVKKEKSLLLPAQKNDEPAPDLNGLHYLRYQAKSGKESVQAAVDGKFPKPEKHFSRVWELDNQFGNIKVQSKKVTAILVPANKDTSTPPAPPDDATHYVCYQVKPVKGEFTDQTPGTCNSSSVVNPKGPCQDDADCGGVGGQFTLCPKPKFRKDLQAFFLDQFDDCALNKEGGTSFAGTTAEGMCLFDLGKVKELCNPMDKTAVIPPRETVAVIDESTATSTQSLLCYQPRLSSKVTNATASGLSWIPVGDKVDPKQSKHLKRRVKDSNAIYTAPGNLFPAPSVVDTNKQELVCIPTDVLSVTTSPGGTLSVNNVVSLGDSLLDAGSPLSPVVAEHIAARLGAPLTKLAMAAATTDGLIINGQHTTAAASFGPGDLAVLWIGGNDFSAISGQIAAGDFSGIDAIEANVELILTTLRAAGMDVVMFNLFDFATVPNVINGFPAHLLPLGTAAADDWRSRLIALGANHGAAVVDVFSLSQQLFATPGDFAVGGVDPVPGPTWGAKGVCSHCIWFDTVHPSSLGQGYIANQAFSDMNAYFNLIGGAALTPLSEAELVALTVE